MIFILKRIERCLRNEVRRSGAILPAREHHEGFGTVDWVAAPLGQSAHRSTRGPAGLDAMKLAQFCDSRSPGLSSDSVRILSTAIPEGVTRIIPYLMYKPHLTHSYYFCRYIVSFHMCLGPSER